MGSSSSGSWVPIRTRAPHDWRRSIRRKRWSIEIAKTTRAIADREKYPVSVMWLVDNDPRATRHQVLPWFHSASDLHGEPKAAPRRKLTTGRDIRIARKEDWESLKAAVSVGRRVERIIVAPEDPDLIRNAKFAEELAEVAATRKIVVELAGGILSHAYYVLRSRGVQVECVDLFGAEADVAEFNKLVRDKIPESIEQKGEEAEIVRLTGEALLSALRQKLVEEAFEVLDAKAGHDVIGELADVQEVACAICGELGVPLDIVESERVEKHSAKGGFEQGLMLTKTSMPHTLSTTQKAGEEVLFDRSDGEPMAVVTQTDEIPASPPYRRPDLRTLVQQPEKIVSFEVELSRVSSERQVTKFTMPGVPSSPRGFALELEFTRVRGVLEES